MITLIFRDDTVLVDIKKYSPNLQSAAPLPPLRQRACFFVVSFLFCPGLGSGVEEDSQNGEDHYSRFILDSCGVGSGEAASGCSNSWVEIVEMIQSYS